MFLFLWGLLTEFADAVAHDKNWRRFALSVGAMAAIVLAIRAAG